MPDSVDHVAYGFVNYMTTEGVQTAQLEADSAYHYPARDEWKLFNLRVEFRSTQGLVRSTVTARGGTYNMRTGDMLARGDVVAETPDGRRLTTCAIEFDEAADQITGPCAFVFDAPGRHLEGESFVADPDFRDVTALAARKGRVGAVDLEKR